MTLILGLILILLGIVWFFATGFIMGRQKLNLTPRDNPRRIAVLIPARDESSVIEGLLESLERQTIMNTLNRHRSPLSMRDVFVIVENEKDPTVKICHKHGASVIIRTRPKRQRKGYALDEALKQILLKHPGNSSAALANNSPTTVPLYDAYFIFDADNRLASDYFEQIFASYRAGYQLATGYRHSKNANANVIAAVSSLTFSMINVVGNTRRIKRGGNIIFSGTGFYIDGRVVENWHGWPFHSLTEDYELSLYAALHGFTTYYNDTAVFYDEQPTHFSQTIAQRTRWIKGYFSARRKYIPLMRRKLRSQYSKLRKSQHRKPEHRKLIQNLNNSGSLRREVIGVKPVITILIGIVIIFLGGLIELSARSAAHLALLAILTTFVLLYLILMFITIGLLKREKLRLRPKIHLRTILFNPIYLVTYVYCALKALLTKNLQWTRIPHGKK